MMTSVAAPAPRNFILLVLGQLVSVFGSALLRFALSLYVLDLTGRADVFATLIALSNLPLLLAPLGGAVADRFNRRNLLVHYDIACGLSILLFFALLLANLPPVPLIAAVMVLLSIVSALYTPVVMASIPMLVRKEKLEQANGIVSGVQALSGIAAPVIGGIVYSWTGIQPLILFSGIAFLATGFLELFIVLPAAAKDRNDSNGSAFGGIAADLKAGFRYATSQPYLFKTMILAALLNLILTPFFIIGGPMILRVTMQANDTLFGLGMGLIELAIIVGALLMGWFAKWLQFNKLHYWLLLISILMVPLAASVTPLALAWGRYTALATFLLCAMPVAMLLTVLSVYVITIVQKRTPDAHLGKVMAIIMAVSQCAAPAGQMLFGLLFEQFTLTVYVPVLVISLLMGGTALAARFMLQNEKGVY